MRAWWAIFRYNWHAYWRGLPAICHTCGCMKSDYGTCWTCKDRADEAYSEWKLRNQQIREEHNRLILGG